MNWAYYIILIICMQIQEFIIIKNNLMVSFIGSSV